MTSTSPVAIVERHLIGVRKSENEILVAPDSRWTVMSGTTRHTSSAPLAYRFVMQAWDFPLASAKLSDAGAGHVDAELKLDNGYNHYKVVLAKYEVSEGLIVKATLHDAKVVVKHA